MVIGNYFSNLEVVFASDPHEILNFMERILDSESFDDFLDRVGESEKENLWLILIKLLEHLNYICVRDYKDNLEDFIYFLIAFSRSAMREFLLNWIQVD